MLSQMHFKFMCLQYAFQVFWCSVLHLIAAVTGFVVLFPYLLLQDAIEWLIGLQLSRGGQC